MLKRHLPDRITDPMLPCDEPFERQDPKGGKLLPQRLLLLQHHPAILLKGYGTLGPQNTALTLSPYS